MNEAELQNYGIDMDEPLPIDESPYQVTIPPI